MRLLLIAIFSKSWFVCYLLPSKLSPGHAAHSNNIRRGEDIKTLSIFVSNLKLRKELFLSFHLHVPIAMPLS